MSWSNQVYFFRPLWINLTLIYWSILLPYRISIGTGFFIGLITDFVFGSILGVRALSLSITTYIVVSKFQLLRNMAIFQQMLIITMLSLITHIIIFLVDFWFANIKFRPDIFYSSIIDGIMWPCFFLMMTKISRYYLIQ